MSEPFAAGLAVGIFIGGLIAILTWVILDAILKR
jgi:hypothetical protein